jgi:NADPH:quinone reductase-like Zn-dependent oxidoreductase
MKAITQNVYGSADVLEFADVDKPTAGPDEVLVEVRAAGVDAGVWHLMTGLPTLVRYLGSGARGPKVPVRGREFAGTVEAVGEGVTRFRPGDEVYGVADGTFAEFAAAQEKRVALRPATLTAEQAAAVPISATTALQALEKGRLQAGQRVLIVGAGGGVGSFAVQIAKAHGAEVTGVCSTRKIDLVTSIGADHVVDYTRDDFTAGPARFDLIIDTAGNRPLSRIRRALTPRGTLVIVGGDGGGRWLGGIDRNLRATLLSPFVGQRLRGILAKEDHRDLERVSALIESGAVRPVVERTFTLSEAPGAIRHAQHGHARGKVVVVI